MFIDCTFGIVHVGYSQSLVSHRRGRLGDTLAAACVDDCYGTPLRYRGRKAVGSNKNTPRTNNTQKTLWGDEETGDCFVGSAVVGVCRRIVVGVGRIGGFVGARDGLGAVSSVSRVSPPNLPETNPNH